MSEEVDPKPEPDVRFAEDIDWENATLDLLIEGVQAGIPEAKAVFDKQFITGPDK